MRMIIALAIVLAIIIISISSVTKAGVQAEPADQPIRALWLETSANLWTILRDREHIQAFLDKAKRVGFNTIIPEAKNSYGYVIYQSKIAPKINDSSLARLDPFKHPAPNSFLPADFDILATLIDEAHKRQMKVVAAVNIFSEGLNIKKTGMAFRKSDWQTVLYTGRRKLVFDLGDEVLEVEINGVNIPCGDDQTIIYTREANTLSPGNKSCVEIGVEKGKIKSINNRATGRRGPSPIPRQGFLICMTGQAREAALKYLRKNRAVEVSEIEDEFVASAERSYLVFVSPLKKVVVEYELSILGEVAKNYQVDGIILDRCRYENIYADFSVEPTGEKWFKRMEDWPSEALEIRPTKLWFTFKPGPFFSHRVGWRAKNIKSFIERAGQVVKKEKPDIPFMNYVAGWYPNYWNEGVNWAAAGYDPDYTWTNEEWCQSGTAQLYDYLLVGVYYKQISGSHWQSMEGGVRLAQAVTAGQTRVVPAVALNVYKKKELAEAIRLVKRMSNGNIMIFDASFVENANRWREVEDALKQLDK